MAATRKSARRGQHGHRVAVDPVDINMKALNGDAALNGTCGAMPGTWRLPRLGDRSARRDQWVQPSEGVAAASSGVTGMLDDLAITG